MKRYISALSYVYPFRVCTLIILRRESIRCKRESIRCRRESNRCRRESIRCRNRAVRPRIWWQRKIPTDGREKSQLMAEKNPNWWKRKILIMVIFENGKYPMQKGKYPMQKEKYPMQEGKYPMQDPCRNGLVSDGRKKSRLMEEKNSDWWQKKIPIDGREKSKSWLSFNKGKYPMQKGKYPIQKGKYPMQKGKYPMQKPCRKGLVSDGRKKSRLMEEKSPNWWQKKSQLMEEKNPNVIIMRNWAWLIKKHIISRLAKWFNSTHDTNYHSLFLIQPKWGSPPGRGVQGGGSPLGA